MNMAVSNEGFWGGRIAPAVAGQGQPLWSSSFLVSALAGAGVGTWQVDMATGEVKWDATTSTIFGLDPAPITTGALLPVHPDDQDAIWAGLDQSMKTGEPYDLIFRGLRSDGEVRWLHGRGRPFPPDQENPRYMAGVVSDVTDRISTIHALNESERQLVSLVENLPGVVYRSEVHAPWQMTFISDAVTDLTGYPAESFLSGELSWADIVSPEDRDAIINQVTTAVEARQKFELRYRIQSRSGEDRWVHERGGATYSDTGEPLFLEGFIGDSHERILAERKLCETEERFRRAAQATRDTIWDCDLVENTVHWDAAVSETLGYAAAEMGGARDWWLSRVHPDDRARMEAEFGNVIAGHSNRLVTEYRFRKADGTYADILDRGYLIRDELGHPSRLVGAMHDLSASKAATLALRDREARLQKIFEQALVGIMEVGQDGRIELVNPRFCEILGRTPDEIRSCSLADYTHPDDHGWNFPLIQEKSAKGEPFQIEKRYVRPNGETVWCNVSVSWVLSDDGKIEKSIVLAEDITVRKNSQAALSNSEMLHRSVVEASADCIKIIGLDGRIEFVNSPGLKAIEVEDPNVIVGQLWRDVWPSSFQKTIDTALNAVRRGKSVRRSGFCPTAKGTPKWWDVSVTPILDAAGNVARILAISRDVTVQRQTAEELKWASEHDALTELPNRRAFEARLQAATIRAMESGRGVGLLLLDLDHFKHVNDSFGHAAGDQLLTALARRLEGCMKKGEFAARLGGDEFAVILEECDEPLDLYAAGQLIFDQLRQPIESAGRMITAGTSIGGARFPDHAQSANELFKNADIALYSLKDSGRGGTCMFHPDMRAQAQLVSSQLSLARVAISDKSIEPHYQPKVELATDRVVGLEALLRWRHVVRGIQTPETVAEAFKDHELATKIGDLMQQRVFADLQAWIHREVPVGFVAINAAPAEFLRDDFAERFLANLKTYEIPASVVEVEVTEHVFFENAAQYVARALGKLHQAGVRIALDDFGTGYSSLTHLRDFPVDVVKIDRSFIKNLTINSEARSIVSAVISLAKSLKIDVVAEGIESELQRTALLAENCSFGQGYLFGRAIQSDEVPHLFAKKAA